MFPNTYFKYNKKDVNAFIMKFADFKREVRHLLILIISISANL